TYRGVFFRARLESPVGPIGLYDVLWLLVLVAVMGVAVRPRADRLLIPMAAFVALAVVSGAIGVGNGQSMYNVSKLLRAEIFLVIGYVAARALTDAGRTAVIRAIVLGGVITAALQVITFLSALNGVKIWSNLGIPAFDTGDTYVSVDFGNPSIFRDNGVTINFAVLSCLILLSAIAVKERIFPRILVSVFMAVLLSGIILSLTRTVWLALVLGLLVIMFVTRLRGSLRLMRWSVPIAVAALAGLVLLHLTTGLT